MNRLMRRLILFSSVEAANPIVDSSLKVHFQAFSTSLSKAQLFTVDGSDFIEKWNGSNGASITDCTQLTQSKKAQYVENEINGHPAVVFDGNDDFFDFSSTLTLGAYTALFVTEIPVSNAQFLVGANFNHLPLARGSGIAVYNYVDQGGAFRAVSLTKPSSANIGIAIRTSLGVHSYILNGQDDTVVSINDSTVADFTMLGKRISGPAINGAAGEIIIYDRVLSPTEIQTNLDYLSPKWGIALV